MGLLDKLLGRDKKTHGHDDDHEHGHEHTQDYNDLQAEELPATDPTRAREMPDQVGQPPIAPPAPPSGGPTEP